MAFPPEFYLIGAQKAATTTLAALLDQQSAVTVSDPKEPQFFTRHWEKGIDWYRGCFAGPETTVYVDASPGYSMAPTRRFPRAAEETNLVYAAAAARIAATNPDARFIYILRDPAQRIWSAYWHNVRAGWEKRPFREAIETRPGYFRASDYAGQIENYQQYFDLDRFLFLKFEDFTKNPQAGLDACAAVMHLEFADPPPSAKSEKKNRSFQFSGAGQFVRTAFGSEERFKKAVKLGQKILPAPLQTALRRTLTTDIPAFSKEDRAFVAGLFLEANQEATALTGLDLSDWYTPDQT
ncbi:MAG: sulfotransferase [Magnetospiraceae bacterium]